MMLTLDALASLIVIVPIAPSFPPHQQQQPPPQPQPALPPPPPGRRPFSEA
jgi:hypothetical protein